MWPAPYELTVLLLVRMLLAFIAVGTVIKLLDGHTDADFDRQTGIVTVTSLLGDATLPYTLVLFTMAVASDAKLAVSLFLAAYAVGMVWDSRRPLPSGLAGWQESTVVIVAGSLFSGVSLQTWAVLSMIWIQCVDDLRDVRIDTAFGQANLARRFGYGEVVLAAAVMAVLMFWWQPLLSLGLTAVAVGIEASFPLLARRWGTVLGSSTATTTPAALLERSLDATPDKNTAERRMMQ